MSEKIVKLPKGETLINEGAHSDSMFLLKEGTLAVYKRRGDKNVLLGHIHSGELVGEMSFLDSAPRSATVMASTDSVCVEIPHDKFKEVEKSLPGWYLTLMKTLLERLRNANAKARV